MIILIWLISWIISGILLYPCIFLSILSGFKNDYHFKFQKYWYKHIIQQFEEIENAKETNE